MATDERARLAAQAEGGQAGLAAYDQAASEISARRTEALQGAMAESATRGAGHPADVAVQNIINAPVNRRLNDIDQAKATFSADQQRLANAQSTYLAGARQFGSRAAARQAEAAAAEARRAAAARQQQDDLEALFNRYGGYQTSTEYDNAVEGGARALQEEAIAGTRRSQQAAQSDREAARQAGSYEARSRQEALRRAAAGGAAASTPPPRRVSRPGESTGDINPGVRGGGQVDGRIDPAYRAAAARMNATPPPVRVSRPGESTGQADRPAIRPPGRPISQVVADTDAQRMAALQALVEAQQAQQQVESPAHLQDLRRIFAIDELGADPLEAAGRFAPLTEREVQEQMIEDMEFERQLQELEAYGVGGREEALDMMFSEATGGFDVGQVSTATNLAPDAVVAASQSPEFADGLEAVYAGPDGAIDAIDLARNGGTTADGQEVPPNPILAAILEEIANSLYGDLVY